MRVRARVYLPALRASIDLAKGSISGPLGSPAAVAAYSHGGLHHRLYTNERKQFGDDSPPRRFNASNRASKSHVKINRQNCGRRKALHETFITSGKRGGCHPAARRTNERTRVWLMRSVVSANMYRRLSPVQHQFQSRVASLESRAMKSNVPVLRDRSYGHAGRGAELCPKVCRRNAPICILHVAACASSCA